MHTETPFAAVFQLAPVPMVISVLDSMGIQDVNAAFTASFGYNATEAIGYTAETLKLWENTTDRQAFEHLLRTTGRIRNLDIRLITKTGWTLDCLASAEIVDLAGQRCVLSVLQDITERKRSEAEMFEAIEAVMQDTSWFSRTVIEKLAQLRHPARPHAMQADLADLTPREREVLGLMCQGLNGDAMAQRLGLARNTIRNHLATLYQKIGANSRSAAIIWARERGITGPIACNPPR